MKYKRKSSEMSQVAVQRNGSVVKSQASRAVVQRNGRVETS